MPNTPFQLPPGLVADDTTFAAPGRWRDARMVRFYEDNWQVRFGWEQLMLDLLGGVCRAVFTWTDTFATLNIAFGTHATLEIWQAGAHVDITPTPPGVTQLLDPAHTFGVDPLFTILGDPKIRVSLQNHGYALGASIRMAGLTNPVGGLNPNGNWVVVAGPFSDVNNFYVQAATNATATVNNGGGAVGSVQIAPFVGFTPGQIDGTGAAGYGTGTYGGGLYSVPSNADYFPLTWSLGAFGGWLMANPRNQTIFVWKNQLAVKAAPLANAPAQVTYMLCVPQRQVMAFGCNEEVSGVFNPVCIRFSDIEDPTVWTTLPSNNAGEVILPGGGRIVCARLVGNYVFVWTENALFLGTYIGSPDQTWSFDKVADNCGSISPGAPIVKSQLATWISPDGQFYACLLGGVPQIVPCPIRTDFVNNISTGQQDKIVGGTISTYGELTWFYPDARDGLECSRDLTVSKQGWCRGQLARTAWEDSGPQPYPVGVGFGRMAYWHEKGNSQDGAPLTGFIESADFYLAEAGGGVMVNGVWPDFRDQKGTFQLTIFTREYAQAPERQHGPFTIQPGQPRKSIRVAGRIARIRYDWSSAPCYARAGRQEFDVQTIGGR